MTAYAFNGTSYTNFSKVTDASGQAVFTLPIGDYRFRVDRNGVQHWSESQNHCSIPGCIRVSLTLPESSGLLDQDALYAVRSTGGYASTLTAPSGLGVLARPMPVTNTAITGLRDEMPVKSAAPGLVQTTTITYTNDAVSRLTAVDGIPYTWDANGNLLSDGTNTYTYDHTNRLTTVSDGQNHSSYAYNGLGDRLGQIVNGATTTYTLDLNAGLTQVLSDGQREYLYGRGRIAQQNLTAAEGQREYFLGDALGSVRQLVDENGEVSLARDYQPYGETLSSSGSGTSPYGYTGEVLDPSGLIYLRARYYQPSTGRFLTRDPWDGDANKPMSYNTWLYGYANPVKYFDPSGRIPSEEEIASDRFVYSCNCGWIDFGHANPSLPNDILRKLRSRPVNSSNLNVREDVLLYQLIVENPGPSMGFAVYPVVKYPPNDQDLDSLALGLHMFREEFRESQQCVAKFGRSCFSEEDLASDLIGFYMAINGIEGDSQGNGSREWLAPICDFPIIKEGPDGARQWSLDVFRNYGEIHEGGNGVREWGSPRLIQTPEISSYCDNKPGGVCSARMWPAEFQTVTPLQPSRNGKWWEYRGQEDGWIKPSNVPEVYFLYVPGCQWPWWLK